MQDPGCGVQFWRAETSKTVHLVQAWVREPATPPAWAPRRVPGRRRHPGATLAHSFCRAAAAGPGSPWRPVAAARAQHSRPCRRPLQGGRRRRMLGGRGQGRGQSRRGRPAARRARRTGRRAWGRRQGRRRRRTPAPAQPHTAAGTCRRGSSRGRPMRPQMRLLCACPSAGFSQQQQRSGCHFASARQLTTLSKQGCTGRVILLTALAVPLRHRRGCPVAAGLHTPADWGYKACFRHWKQQA